MPKSDWITTAEALRLSGYNLDYLRRILRSGKIESRKWNREWQISKASLLDYLKRAEKSPDKRRGPQHESS